MLSCSDVQLEHTSLHHLHINASHVFASCPAEKRPAGGGRGRGRGRTVGKEGGGRSGGRAGGREGGRG